MSKFPLVSLYSKILFKLIFFSNELNKIFQLIFTIISSLDMNKHKKIKMKQVLRATLTVSFILSEVACFFSIRPIFEFV